MTFRWREFRVLDGQLVMLVGIEIRELIDTIQYIGNELFQKNARGHANLPTQSTGNGASEFVDVRIPNFGCDAIWGTGVHGVDVADFPTNFA